MNGAEGNVSPADNLNWPYTFTQTEMLSGRFSDTAVQPKEKHWKINTSSNRSVFPAAGNRCCDIIANNNGKPQL